MPHARRARHFFNRLRAVIRIFRIFNRLRLIRARDWIIFNRAAVCGPSDM